MEFLSDSERRVVHAVAGLATGNPFLPERIDQERAALGERFQGITAVWHEGAELERETPNVEHLAALGEQLAPIWRERLVGQALQSVPMHLAPGFLGRRKASFFLPAADEAL